VSGPPEARVLAGALSWLDAHRARFRLPADVTEAGADHNLTLKPLGELAQLSLSIARVSPAGGPAHTTARDLLDFAWRETHDGELYLELARAEPHATHLVEMYAPFAQAGLRHEGFEDFASFMAGTRSWSATEAEPTRLLAVLRAEERLGLRRASADGGAASAVRRTWLGGLPEPWAFERRSGYALTHHVFHVTDWGTDRAGLPSDLAGYLTHWLPAWLDSCLEEERWDLAGELLAVQACLPPAAYSATTGAHGVDARADESWARYAAVQSPAGAYAERGAVPGGDDDAAFRACYHATLVAAFAAALTAHRNTPPPDGSQP
jgi:hypothetical protein